jgi:hypothetical protein
MTQMEPQSAGEYWWRFRPGESGNPLGPTELRRCRVETKCHELAEELGGWDSLSKIERVLLEQAASLLVRSARHPPNAEDAVRITNTISRVLRTVERRRDQRAGSAHCATPSLKGYLEGKAAVPAPGEAAGASSAAPASTCPPADKAHPRPPCGDGGGLPVDSCP